MKERIRGSTEMIILKILLAILLISLHSIFWIVLLKKWIEAKRYPRIILLYLINIIGGGLIGYLVALL